MTLNLNSLSNVKKDVELPAYDRSKLNIGIFHFGVGGFHRAHQAVIMDDLFNKGLALDFGICGVGVLPIDSRMRDVMRAQNCLYTLVEKASNGSKRTKVVGSIIDYLFAPDDVDAVIEKIVEQAKIVSMTITEGGYNIDPVTGDFDLNTVKWDIENSSKPKTVFGIVIEALRRRKQRGMQGFTIMSCDNLQENGKIAKRAFTGYDKAVDSDLAKWMEEHVSFPCSMVDRITPVTTDDDRKNVSEAVGLVDQWPVVCEDFLQWVLEDRFVAGRPPFEKSTVHVVPDVEPYELMKLRLLNAGHQGIAYFGLLMGYQFVHDVTQNELIVDYYKAYMEKEAEHTLRPISGINLREYQLKLVERFQNPYIRDTLARLAGMSLILTVNCSPPTVTEKNLKPNNYPFNFQSMARTGYSSS